MVNYNIDEKRIIVAILVSIMEADGIIDPHETDFLDNIITSFGMTEDDMDSMDEFDFNEIIVNFKKIDKQKKADAIALFVDMAKCDGYADPRELKIIESLGA